MKVRNGLRVIGAVPGEDSAWNIYFENNSKQRSASVTAYVKESFKYTRSIRFVPSVISYNHLFHSGFFWFFIVTNLIKEQYMYIYSGSFFKPHIKFASREKMLAFRQDYKCG